MGRVNYEESSSSYVARGSSNASAASLETGRKGQELVLTYRRGASRVHPKKLHT